MKPSELKIYISLEKYDEKNCWKLLNCYVAEKRIVSKLSMISIPNLIKKFENLNEDCVKISRPYLICFPKAVEKRRDRAGTGRVGPTPMIFIFDRAAIQPTAVIKANLGSSFPDITWLFRFSNDLSGA